MTDNRQPWEVEYCLRFNFAASYLKHYNATGKEAAFLSFTYGNGDLKKWAQDHITELLDKCETLRAGRDLSAAAQSAVEDSCARLGQAGLFGSAKNVGIMRIELA
jgi:hypothetical protein